MNNNDFLNIIKQSFFTYLQKGTSRSTAKLKSLHGQIAKDIKEKLGNNYIVKSQGYNDDREGSLNGRYYIKNTDITVYRKINNELYAMAGYAIKFVMRNYSQNSNNYFENMLGETANIRANKLPYFQIFIIFDKVPYYEKGGKFKKWDEINKHNLNKYLIMAKDNTDISFHTPNKTLIVLIHLKEKSCNHTFYNDIDYANYYKSIINNSDLIIYSDMAKKEFAQNSNFNIIYNDYEDFLIKTCYLIQSI